MAQSNWDSFLLVLEQQEGDIAKNLRELLVKIDVAAQAVARQEAALVALTDGLAQERVRLLKPKSEWRSKDLEAADRWEQGQRQIENKTRQELGQTKLGLANLQKQHAGLQDQLAEVAAKRRAVHKEQLKAQKLAETKAEIISEDETLALLRARSGRAT